MDAIISALDSKYEKFFFEHWLRSLKDNVDLSDVDIWVIDYGIKKDYLDRIRRSGVKIYQGKRDGHVAVVRFRELSVLLKKNSYDQVLFADGGDIIFQTDIREAMRKDKRSVRVAYDEMNEFLKHGPLGLRKEIEKKAKVMLKKSKMINAGVIFSSGKRLQEISEEIYYLVKDKHKYGPDQLALDYILKRDGFKLLDNKYNFVIATTDKEFYVQEGQFFFETGDLIPIVHNAGNSKIMRPMDNFGYGKKYNKLKKALYSSIRVVSRKLRELNDSKVKR
ncbi:MAG: hypothetical protein NDI94_03080 [Candidatus Woesearchaeota archaeon]|nr:hypothetical protein [Candidatus Woesearchaeota archaeon]